MSPRMTFSLSDFLAFKGREMVKSEAVLRRTMSSVARKWEVFGWVCVLGISLSIFVPLLVLLTPPDPRPPSLDSVVALVVPLMLFVIGLVVAWPRSVDDRPPRS